LVDIDGDAATLTPVSGLRPDGDLHLMTIVSPGSDIIDPPFVVR
jgi:hypothetical protein